MNFLKNFDHFLFDLDGVVYVGKQSTKEAVKVLGFLREAGKKITFITNNPTRSPQDYVKKLKLIGIKSKSDEFITSPMAVAYYLRKNFRKLDKKKAYIAGSKYLKKEVTCTGLILTTGKNAEKVDFVILGGHDKFNYEEIKTASSYIRKGAKFIATNRDAFYPSDTGFLPATGALLASVETAAEKKAVIVGKPERYIFDLVTTAGKRSKTVLVGDNLQTDISGGKNSGFKTALSLTGATSRKVLKESEISPDYVIKDLTSLIKIR